MFFDTLENKSKLNERKLNEIKLRYEQISRDIEQLFKEFDISPEDISTYVSNPDNFSPRTWAEFEKRTKALEERLESDLKTIRDVDQAKKSFEDKHISKNWIFCK